MITPTYCTVKQSKLLKEKGFKELSEYNQWILAKDKGDDSKKFICHSNDLNDYIGIDEERQYNVYHCLTIPEQWIVVEWLRVKHNINVEANYLPNISKYRWVAKPMNIIPKSFKTVTEYAIAVDRYYGKENFDTPQAAYSAAIDYVLTNLI